PGCRTIRSRLDLPYGCGLSRGGLQQEREVRTGGDIAGALAHVLGHQIGPRGEAADADMLAVLATRGDRAEVRVAHAWMVELAGDAELVAQIVGADEQKVHAVHRRDLLDVFQRRHGLHHHDYHRGVVHRAV